MINAGTVVALLTLNTSPFKNSLKSAGTDLKTFMNSGKNANKRLNALGSGLKTIGATMTSRVSLPLAAIGGICSKTAATFEKKMSNVKALSHATGKDFELLKDTAKKMGASTKYSASEAADGLKYMSRLLGSVTRKLVA